MADRFTLATLTSLSNPTSAIGVINSNNAIIQAAGDDPLSRSGAGANQMNTLIDMNSNSIINLAAPTNANDAARLIDIQNIQVLDLTVPTLVSGKVLSNDGLVLTWTNVGAGDVISTNNLSDLTSASTARTNLGLIIGTNVQAYNANLTGWAALTPFAGSLVITTGKTLTSTNTLTLSGTDGSTLVVGSGGTLGSLSFLNSVNNANWSGTALSVFNGGTGSSTAGGAALDNITGFSTTGSLYRTGAGTYITYSPNGIILVATGVNFNSANTDTVIPVSIPFGTRYRISSVVITNASASLTTATFGLYTAAAAGGIGVLTGQAITVTTGADNTLNNLQSVSVSAFQGFNTSSLYFRVGTAQGSPATGNVVITIAPLYY